MLVIWAETQEKAHRFAEAAHVGTGGIIFAGNRMSRSLDGLRPTAVIEIDGVGATPGGQDMKAVLLRSVRKSSKPVPWLKLVVET